MADVANATIVGRLSRDPEVRFSGSGTAVANFSIAVEKFRKGKAGAEDTKTVSFFDVVAFGKHGEHIAERVAKGTTVGVIGTLQQRSWEKDGKRYYKVEVIADRMFAEGNGGSSSPAPGKEGGRKPEDDDDIPF